MGRSGRSLPGADGPVGVRPGGGGSNRCRTTVRKLVYGGSGGWERTFESRMRGSRVREVRVPGFTHLHTVSGFSMRYGASHPERLAERAGELGMDALALTDRDTVAGTVRFAKACAA